MAEDLDHEQQLQADAEDRAAQSNAAELLRAFEDDKLGEDAVRINGQIERGHGSKFRDLSEEDQAKYGAIEKLVAAEQALADATTAHRAAEEAYEAAIAAVDAFDTPAPELEAPADA